MIDNNTYIDLRSDTTTFPTEEMLKAMTTAALGDDVYKDDATTNLLEEKCAALLGKEAALFVPSGTMGNQICIMTHTNRGEEIIAEADSHIMQHERAAIAMLSAVMPKVIKGSGGIMSIDEISRSIRPKDVHYPATTLICLENALGNGTVIPLEHMAETYAFAKERGISVHLDGARLFNAAEYLGCHVKELVKYTDSVSFCLSKGLCAPIGSVIAGTKHFIDKAIENRKALGGGMRQTGVLAAAGIIAVDKMSKRLHEDHENAKYLADRLLELGSIELDKTKVHINMVFFKINKPGFDIYSLDGLLLKKGIKINGAGSNYGDEKGLFRFVTHNGITLSHIDTVISELKEILS